MFWTSSDFFGLFNITGLIPTVPKEKARDMTVIWSSSAGIRLIGVALFVERVL